MMPGGSKSQRNNALIVLSKEVSLNLMRGSRLLMVATATLTLSSSLYASGFSIFEQGAKASAMAGAYTATADDPSAMFYNVAGIAYQRKMGAYAGATMITFRNEFRGSNETYPGPETVAQFEDHIFVL